MKSLYSELRRFIVVWIVCVIVIILLEKLGVSLKSWQSMTLAAIVFYIYDFVSKKMIVKRTTNRET